MESTLPLDGVILHYELRGEGPPLLLLHGGTGCHADRAYAGRERFEREYRLIITDVRGHGRSAVPSWTELPKTLTHRHCALDTLALFGHLSIERCKAIGVSMGGNILLHMATMQPERLEAIVIVSATPYFPEQARKVMADSASGDGWCCLLKISTWNRRPSRSKESPTREQCTFL